ncbi:MAG TPA: alpha/beta fold hydrolase [Vicinamibacterales bacterium]|nr:alpha/beta fold hydrolase [Vicinamibacterales bacterium]
MRAFDAGAGQPVIVIPGLQGRWEWMWPSLVALSRKCRAISYSLGHAVTLDDLVAQLDRVLDEREIASAAICGVSFGGVVALRYAAARPRRTKALVLVSAPSPSWRPSARQANYLANPWLSTPAFVATSPMRMWPEICAAIPSAVARTRFAVTHAARIAMHPIVPAGMAARIALMNGRDFRADCARVQAPTLVMTGEDELDLVVPPSATREYTQLIRSARYELFEKTGHIGLITQPDRFADVVSGFLNANCP